MRRKIRSLLQLADLKEEEIQLYLLLLKLQQASASELIENSGLGRMMVYRSLQSLEDQGLLQKLALNQKTSMYKPLSLNALIKKIDVEQRKLRRLQLALQDLDGFLPMMDLSQETNETKEAEELVEVREGLDAFREEYLSMPDYCEDEYLHVGHMENYWDAAQWDYDCPEEISFRNKRYKKGVYCRIVNVWTPQSEEFVRRDSREMRTSKLCDSIPITKNYLAVGAKKVCHFLCDEHNPRVVVIKHPELIEMHRGQFGSLWNG